MHARIRDVFQSMYMYTRNDNIYVLYIYNHIHVSCSARCHDCCIHVSYSALFVMIGVQCSALCVIIVFMCHISDMCMLQLCMLELEN